MGLESLRTIPTLAAIRDLGVIQFDITSAYLHGTLKGGGLRGTAKGLRRSWERRLGVWP